MRRPVILALVLLCVSCERDHAVPSTFAIATGGPAGLYYPFGGGMASIWSKHLDGINVKAEVTGGSVTNVIQVARQESELGISMADVVTDAYLGQGRFPEPLPIRVLFTAYPNIVHILTLESNGIDSVRSLGGKRVSLGAAGSGTAVAAENVLTGLGVELEDIAPVWLNFGETTAALKDGTIDAGFVVGGLGLAAVTELAVTRDLRLIELSAADLSVLGQRFPAYSGYVIPGGTYNRVDQDVQALGIWSVVVAHEDLSPAIARAMVCTIYEHRESLLKVSQVAAAMTIDNIEKLPAVPLHDGTRAYLDDMTAGCSL